MKNSNLKGFRPEQGRAFTLVELLVVIAVVSILVALLTPSLSTAKQRAQQITCINNLKQIGVAVTMYVNDHDGNFPGCVDFAPWPGREPYKETVAGDIQYSLNNYLGTANGTGTNNINSPVWTCPVAMKDQAAVGIANYPHKITYRWNSYEMRGPDSMWFNIGDVSRVPRSIASVRKASHAALMWDLPDWVEPELHFSKVNCVFVDAHVQAVEMVPTSMGSTPDTLWWFAGDLVPPFAPSPEGWAN